MTIDSLDLSASRLALETLENKLNSIDLRTVNPLGREAVKDARVQLRDLKRALRRVEQLK